MPKFFIGRREFTLGAAAAATTTLLRPAAALPQTQTQATESISELDKKTRETMAKLTPQARAEVEMKLASIFRKYGDRLSDEQKADIRRIMAETQDGLERMRTFHLENGDQPADAFGAYRSESSPTISSKQVKAGQEKK